MRRRSKQLMRRTKPISAEHDHRPPFAIKMPAEPGWRVVWVDWVKEAHDDVPWLHPTVGVVVAPVTFWGIEAPQVYPDPNEQSVIVSTLGQGMSVVHLHGPAGDRLPPYARVFRIADPRDPRTDEQLREDCWEWLRRDYTRQVQEQAERRPPARRKSKKPSGGA